MLTFLTSLLLFSGDATESASDLLKKAGPSNAKEVRLNALRQLRKIKRKDPATVCETLEGFPTGENAEIRMEVLLTLAVIGYQAKRECPLPIVNAINDENETVRSLAGDLVIAFKSFPKAIFPEVVKASKSEDWELRETAAHILHGRLGKSPRGLKILKRLLDDSNQFVRYQAHLSHFKATKDFSRHITYFLEYTSDLNEYRPAKSPAEKKVEERRKLTHYLVAIAMYRFTQDRPKKLAKELLTNLSHEKAAVRQCALRQLRAMVLASHESYRAIPKEKAMKAVTKLFSDKNEEVQTWAYWVDSLLEEGPPKGTPEKMKPLDTSTAPKSEFDKKKDQER